MSIEDYNWDELYKRAEEFCSKNIPNAKVNTGIKSFAHGCPRPEILFFC